jgi:hypothetical protein
MQDPWSIISKAFVYIRPQCYRNSSRAKMTRSRDKVCEAEAEGLQESPIYL